MHLPNKQPYQQQPGSYAYLNRFIIAKRMEIYHNPIV